MRNRMRDTAVAIAAASAVVVLAACGQGTTTGATGGHAPRIALLMPNSTTARWEGRDRPLLEKRIKELCAECRVEHADAGGDVATQQRQMDSMITNGVDVIVVAAVDAKSLSAAVEKADRAGVRVIAYDRLAGGPIEGFVSFDGEQVGRLQGRALLRAMRERGHGDGGRIVMINGDPTDPNAVAFKKGALSVLEGRAKISRAYDTLRWRTETAYMNMSGAIAALRPRNIDGVYAANDNLAAGAIAALKANKVDPLPPITGQDAGLEAVRRIVGGEQYMTVYKPFTAEADAGARMAVATARGKSLDRVATDRVNNGTRKAVPAVLLTPVAVTVGTIKDTVVKGGAYTIGQICVPRLEADCHRAGLTG
ncbi:substrate-binding domain-containing protein [Streptomyces beihaiensis]|uniref:Substrate-binding domain-containing protein n=1 Tax=Streptomyces beihaiensis TaxID=2984495 RepID=A0ABT3TXD1_9ACTN|nr:substrate-binding domain-containing protein [Streptomyces beihaiensis]MCX3061704.1 substrate-binding domain-containing protein [Streptomyces beihaiensis]